MAPLLFGDASHTLYVKSETDFAIAFPFGGEGGTIVPDEGGINFYAVMERPMCLSLRPTQTIGEYRNKSAQQSIEQAQRGAPRRRQVGSPNDRGTMFAHDAPLLKFLKVLKTSFKKFSSRVRGGAPRSSGSWLRSKTCKFQKKKK